MREPIRIGIDIAKSSFQLAVRNRLGKVRTVRLRRAELLEHVAQQHSPRVLERPPQQGAIPVADKMARIAWAVWTRGEPYQKLRAAA